MERSWNVALPAPPPPPEGMCAVFVTPQEYDSTSTSSLCLSSRDSPLMSPIFAKMSAAMATPEHSVMRLTAGRTWNAAEETRDCDLESQRLKLADLVSRLHSIISSARAMNVDAGDSR